MRSLSLIVLLNTLSLFLLPSQAFLSFLTGGNKVKRLLRNWRNLPDGFARPKDAKGNLLTKRPKKPREPIPIYSVEDLKEKISEGYRVEDVDVRGDIYNLLFTNNSTTTTTTATSTTTNGLHPVVKLLYDRKEAKSRPRERKDPHRVAIAIEGGGMRGCVGAGMITAVWYLGLQDSVDVVYGSSAGSLVGAYFIAQQLPYYGPEVYYDVLTTAGKDFIDAQSILRSCGLGLLDLRLKSLKSLFTDRMGKPVLNLNYLFTNIVQRIKPLDWEVFWQQQKHGIELKVVASGLLTKQSLILSARDGNFQTLDELAQCMKASMLLPGVTGDAICLRNASAMGKNIFRPNPQEAKSEPLSDALLYEPIPYRSAIKENCSHILVFRTRADDNSVTKKMSFMEKMIMQRFFGRKLKLPELVDWMVNQYHKLIYAEDILRINAANRCFDESQPGPKLYGVALPPGVKEIKRMETSREVIFENVRLGFAAAYDSLVSDVSQRGKGYEVAKEIWPDRLMSEPARHLQDNTLSSSASVSPSSCATSNSALLLQEMLKEAVRMHEKGVEEADRAKEEEVIASVVAKAQALPSDQKKRLLGALSQLSALLEEGEASVE
eukprot:gene9972-11023_t